jgi:hypothetical protein
MSNSDWGARWFQWVASMPATGHPNRDGPCDQAQDGPVWFLGTPPAGTTERSCTVPSGKGIMVVASGMFYTSTPENECEDNDKAWCTEPNLQAIQDFCLNDIGTRDDDVCVEVNGVAVENLRDYYFVSDLFTLQGDPNDPLLSYFLPYGPNNCGPLCAEGQLRQAVFCGYWVVLEPLPAGEHTLRFYLTYPDGSVWREALYQITVE